MTIIKGAGQHEVIGPPAAGTERMEPEEAEAEAEHPSEAVRYDRSATSLHRAYVDAASEDAKGRAARVAAIKAQVRAGTYEPDLRRVAERMLSDIGSGKA